MGDTHADPATGTDTARATEAVRALARASSLLERSSKELNLAHYRVLSAVASGQERASHVAARLAVGRPAVSAAVESLSRRGLLARLEADGDHRAVTLRLTAEGQQLLARVEAEMLERMNDLAGRTPDPDGLLDALVWLGRALDERRAQRARASELAGPAPPGPAPRGPAPPGPVSEGAA
jgi:DNA-binding MarR family transcriptional regulator